MKKKITDIQTKQSKATKKISEKTKHSLIAQVQTNFYSDRYELIISILVISIILNTLFIYFLWYIYTNRPEPAYFAMNQKNELNLIGQFSPQISQQTVLNKGMILALKTTSYNFESATLQTKMLGLQGNFTSSGFSAFTDAIIPILQNLIDKQVRQISYIANLPTISDPGTYEGLNVWQVIVPILLKRVGISGEVVEQHGTVKLQFQQVSPEDNPDGIQIYNYSLQLQEPQS